MFHKLLLLMISMVVATAPLFAAPPAPEGQRPTPEMRAPEQKPGVPPTPGETVSRGRLLYENHCMHCHESTLHIREARRADSLKALEGWVMRWSDQQKLGWGPEEVADVVEYLNRRYYKFPPPGGKK